LISVQISSDFERERGKFENGLALGNSNARIPVWGNLAYVIVELPGAIFGEFSVFEGLVGLIRVLPRDRRWPSGIAQAIDGSEKAPEFFTLQGPSTPHYFPTSRTLLRVHVPYSLDEFSPRVSFETG
jgi:hypothetical protein